MTRPGCPGSVRSRPSLAGHDLIEPVQQFPERQRSDDVTVTCASLFRDEAPCSVLGVDRPLGVVFDEALLPDDLIKRQTHDSFPCLDPWTREGPCPAHGSASRARSCHTLALLATSSYATLRDGMPGY
jgi:uncharacterized protein YceK